MPKIARPAIMEPTAMPALAPVESPLPPPDEEPAAGVCEADSPVPAEGVAVGVGASKLSLVTLKHGTWMLKSLVSTKV